MYFRHVPYPMYWILLIMMSILNFINNLYSTSDKNKNDETNNLTEKSYELIKKRYQNQTYYLYKL